jgi:hypothetical protein
MIYKYNCQNTLHTQEDRRLICKQNILFGSTLLIMIKTKPTDIQDNRQESPSTSPLICYTSPPATSLYLQVLGFHSCVTEDFRLLGYEAVLLGASQCFEGTWTLQCLECKSTSVEPSRMKATHSFSTLGITHAALQHHTARDWNSSL